MEIYLGFACDRVRMTMQCRMLCAKFCDILLILSHFFWSNMMEKKVGMVASVSSARTGEAELGWSVWLWGQSGPHDEF